MQLGYSRTVLLFGVLLLGFLGWIRAGCEDRPSGTLLGTELGAVQPGCWEQAHSQSLLCCPQGRQARQCCAEYMRTPPSSPGPPSSGMCISLQGWSGLPSAWVSGVHSCCPHLEACQASPVPGPSGRVALAVSAALCVPCWAWLLGVLGRGAGYVTCALPVWQEGGRLLPLLPAPPPFLETRHSRGYCCSAVLRA